MQQETDNSSRGYGSSYLHSGHGSGLLDMSPGGSTLRMPGLDTGEAPPVILELRKEKSRDAARSRRGKENYEFYELAKMLPLPAAITSQLDKASIIRLTISYLKLRDFSSHGDPPWNREGPPPNKSVKVLCPPAERLMMQSVQLAEGNQRRRSMAAVAMEIFETHQGTHILQSLDGFAFSLSNDGRFLYISETVSIYLGLSQVEMTGSSIFDYVHVGDHSELAEQLGLCLPQHCNVPSASPASEEGATTSSTSSNPRPVSPPLPERGWPFDAAIMNPSPSKGYDRSFCIRMKSTLTKRGVHIKTSGYRVVQILSHMRPQFSFSLTRKHPPPLLGLVAMAIALPPPTVHELLIDNDMFVTRLTQEFKITYCEPRISDLMDISADDLTSKNLYDYCHAEDLQKLRKAHVDLLNKGQVLTEYYRMMNKHGGFVWLQTCATIICSKNSDEQSIIAINYVLSGIEYGGCVMDMKQMSMLPNSEPDPSDHSESEHGSDRDDKKEELERRTPNNKGQSQDTERRGSKRKHTASQDNTGSVQDMADVEQNSPENSLAMLYQSAAADDTATLNHIYNEDLKFTVDKQRSNDTKNSRRKMERPRKRKRESDNDGESQIEPIIDVDNPASIDTILNGGTTAPEAVHENGNGTSLSVTGSSHSSIPASPQDIVSKMTSPAPEDLSVKASQDDVISSHANNNNNNTTSNLSDSSSDKWPLTTNSASEGYSEVSTTTSSVRDLEEVMNKHLPALPSDTAEHLRSGFHGDYTSAQGLLGFHQKHKSTIQWIGSQHTHSGTTAAEMSATHLLRTLYANRESVIRTNVYNPRPQYYADMQTSLLTPPGGNEASPFVTPQVNQAKTPPTTYGLMSGYSSNPISVTMSGGLTEPYSMTPPSSVSPQDKYGAFSDQCHTDSQLRSYADGGNHTMPIKPQAYPLPAHANTHMSAYDRTSQYAGGSYYPGSGGFAAYNHGSSPTPAHYRDATKNGSW